MTLIDEVLASAALPPVIERKRLRVEVLKASLRRVARELEVTPQAVLFWETEPEEGGHTPRGVRLVRYVDLLSDSGEARATIRMTPAVYTADQLAQLTGVSTWSIYNSVKVDACPFPFVKIGKRVVFPKAPVDRALGLSVEEMGE